MAVARDRITSDIPGRMRVRVAPHKRDHKKMEAVRSRMHTVDGVGDVQVEHHSGSVLVNYDPRSGARAHLIDELKFVGVDVATELEEKGEGEPADIATAIIDAVMNANERFGRVTGRRADLRLVAPFALGTWGAYRLYREGVTLAIPAHLLLWWSFDLFWKIHVAARQAATSASTNAG